MAPEDEENTVFVTERGLYCYKMMPSTLKNTGAIFQHLINKVFKQQISQNIEIYVDDMIVKSIEEDRHITDLKEVFGELRKYRMKLNPNKCTFKLAQINFLTSLLIREE